MRKLGSQFPVPLPLSLNLLVLFSLVWLRLEYFCMFLRLINFQLSTNIHPTVNHVLIFTFGCRVLLTLPSVFLMLGHLWPG